VIIVHGDMGLQIPDYQASWNNFCVLTDCFTQFEPEHFVVQTFAPESPSIQYACRLDQEAFLRADHAYRKQFLYPPYALLCVIHYKHEQEKRVITATNKLYQELLYCKDTYSMSDIVMYITPPLLYKKFGKFRYTIILK
jgi:primosomal protein N' (replication factor Y) (superfamily II helicase)